MISMSYFHARVCVQVTNDHAQHSTLASASTWIMLIQLSTSSGPEPNRQRDGESETDCKVQYRLELIGSRVKRGMQMQTGLCSGTSGT